MMVLQRKFVGVFVPLRLTFLTKQRPIFANCTANLMRVPRPEGAIEAQLAERAIIRAWRLRRLYRIETGKFSKARKLWASTGPTLACDLETVYTRLSSQRD